MNMKKAQIQAILLGIAARLRLAYDWVGNMEDDGKYSIGVIEGAYFVASCEIVQYVYPLIGLDDGLGASDLIGWVEGKSKENPSEGKILKRLEKLVYNEEKQNK